MQLRWNFAVRWKRTHETYRVISNNFLLFERVHKFWSNRSMSTTNFRKFHEQKPLRQTMVFVWIEKIWLKHTAKIKQTVENTIKWWIDKKNHWIFIYLLRALQFVHPRQWLIRFELHKIWLQINVFIDCLIHEWKWRKKQ